VRDPYETDNVAGSLSATRLAQLDKMMNGLVHCAGMSACWTAGLPGARVPRP
jgi:hypothetical protein